MKKAILTISMLLCTLFFLILVWPTQAVSFWDIPVLETDALDALVAERTCASGVLSFRCHAGEEALPVDKQSNTWYTPALTKQIALDLPWPWRIARTEATADPSDGDTCRILIYNPWHYYTCTLIETGLPVTSITLQRFDLAPEYIEAWRTPATARIVTQASDGTLAWSTNRIDIKIRGNSSLVYPKKSYTVFFVDGSGNDLLQSPLGLPADRKFALNSLHEDDSKIRDALSYWLWQYVEPENALQLEYTELIINDEYYGLYGMHGLPTENSLPFSPEDVIYKINGRIYQSASVYQGDLIPKHEIVAGDPYNVAPLQRFMKQFAAGTDRFPAVLDWENFVNNAVFREILASEDTYLENLVITYCAAEDTYRLTPWDLDQSFGNVFNGNAPCNVAKPDDQVCTSHLRPSSTTLRLLPALYASHPDFAEAVAARYRELRKTVFTDETMLEDANRLFDRLTDCGARQRDAERWPDSASCSNNSFIETFIPARMAFLDSVFGVE